MRANDGLKKKIKPVALAGTIGAGVIAVLFCLPFLYMLLCSLQPESSDIFKWPPKVFPEKLRFENYKDAFETMVFPRAFGNTLLLVVSVMGLTLLGSVLVSYGFARFEARGKSFLFSLLLSTMMLPWVITMIPSFALYRYIGWIGTRLPLIIPAVGGSAFNIFLLRQFMLGLPKSLDEAAMLDGCSTLGILVKILLPNMKPVLATLIVFSFNNVWGDYVGPSIYLLDAELQTLSLSLYNFQDASGVMEWNKVMAGCVMFSLPMVVVLFSAQNAFVRGIVSSGIKE
ncbi:MAG: carbohydrate ABC transporter permease [Clostridia bacterium]|nr:carbohydrate ABC transporter permease [Clostridia bacterium]